MVLAAAVISLAVLGPAADPRTTQAEQPPAQPAASDSSRPYSVEGVRRAFDSGAQPAMPVLQTRSSARGRDIAVASTSQAGTLRPSGDRPVWEGTYYPTWHEEFLSMAGPQSYNVPYTGMNNSERIVAAATSIGIGLAFQALYSWIHDQVASSSRTRQQKKLDKVRAEIQAELAELERLNAAARASVR